MPPGTAPGHTPALTPEPPSRWRAVRTSVIAVVALVTAAVVTGPVTPPAQAAAAEPVSGFATVELVHVYNNYYRDSSYGIASTYEAGVPAEGDYFHSVNNPGRVDFSGDLGRLVERNNILVACNHPIETRGSVTEPRTYYPYTADPPADVPAVVQAGAGVGKIGY
ncbi:hypothetical protein [Nonomuraea indica]|uniref:Uncharacterized protein n=1 Tax=Nonomuraea indica TaxID=1581193 RepID=A0ABW8A760_9ACTN